MNFARGIEPVTALKTKASELIRRAREGREPIIITQNGKPAAVLQDVDSFQRQREALLLLRYLAQGMHEARLDHSVGDKAAEEHFRNKLSTLKTLA